MWLPASESQRGVKASGRGMVQHPRSKYSFKPLNFQYANPKQLFSMFPNREGVWFSSSKKKKKRKTSVFVTRMGNMIWDSISKTNCQIILFYSPLPLHFQKHLLLPIPEYFRILLVDWVGSRLSSPVGLDSVFSGLLSHLSLIHLPSSFFFVFRA